MPVLDEVLVGVGDKVYVADTDWLEIGFGLFEFGKVPTSWSGRPFAVSTRELLVHDQREVLVAFTEAVLLKAL
jgi:hypothetical protein